ncbi:MAG TPA: efflux RND transporter periplasmic adaptor subunit [Thermoanaerobaculia bacterium]|nr:efflux RND transporter periplasmic adaptor subunit [Thermoanaerobaculia bacterium]
MKKLVVAVVVLLAVGAIFVARTPWPVARAVPPEPQGPGHRQRVTGNVRNAVKATGVIKPMIGAEVRVGSRLSGVVRRLYVKIGDRVEKGQLLAELDDRDLVARRREALAALQLAEANLDYASADLARKRELRASALLAPSELDLARRAYAVAEQQRDGARASLQVATTQLDYGRIAAPIAGVVASVSTQEGETVAASFATPTFVTLLDLGRLEVWAYVDETDIGRIRIGQPATFTVDTYGATEFAGRVTAIYPKAEIRDNVVNYVTVIRFETPPDKVLRPDMTTTVRIEI